MKSRFMKALSAMLSVCMVISAIPTASAVDLASNTGTNNPGENLVNDVSVTGTNSFGKMFSEIYNENSSKQDTTGYGVYSVEFTDNVATVKYDALQTATLVVGLFEEKNSSSMIISEEIEVTKDNTVTEITFDSAKMPEYFYVKAYLVDSETFRPLSTEYTSPMYTEDMQKLEKLSTTDFPEEQVLNLDDDTENNFAVYNDDVKVVSETAETNIVKTVDDTNGVYVFENIDSSISSLKPGDTFSYAYGEEDGLIIAKVSDITIDGTTATITSDELEMDQVFDYVKIDVAPTINQAEISTDELPKGVEYNGLVSDSTRIKNSKGVVPSGGTFSADMLSFKFQNVQIGKEGFLKYCYLNGSVKLELTPGVELKLTPENNYFEFKIDYALTYNVSVSTRKDVISSTEPANPESPQPIQVVSFGYIKFTHISGVSIKITPGLALSVTGEITLEGKLTGTVGFRISNGGCENITTTPRLEVKIKAECIIFIGVSLNPELSFLADLASAGVSCIAGVEARASIAKELDTGELFLTVPSVHDCDWCIQGEFNFKLTLSFIADILNSESMKYKADLINISAKISDFYYSIDHNSFDFTVCPFKKHKITVTALDSSGEPIEFAYITVRDVNGELVKISNINDYGIADENGKESFYLQPGEYTISAYDSLGKYREETKSLVVSNNAKSITINLLTHDEIINDYFDRDEKTPSQLAFGPYHSSCITEDGDLYMWGKNDYGQLGVDVSTTYLSTPKKIWSKVSSVSLSEYQTACVTENGELYMWGRDIYYHGAYSAIYKPTYIMSDVRTVSLGEMGVAVITKNDELYTWGYNKYGELGNGTTNAQHKAQEKVLSDVKTVCFGGCQSAAITNNGDLYTWGDNSEGELGNGTTNNQYKPEKILEKVKMVDFGADYGVAVANNGNLYTWGSNNEGQLGTGDKTIRQYLTPQHILSDVDYVKATGWGCACITKYGQLYRWGYAWDMPTVFIPAIEEEIDYSPIYIMGDVKQLSWYPGTWGAISDEGDLYMWGYNYTGNLGDGTNEDKQYPTKITTIPEKVKEIEQGDFHTGVITESGEIYTWGWNPFGQLGDGTYEDRYTPTKITLPTDESSTVSSQSNSNTVLSSTPNVTTAVTSGTGTSATKSFDSLMPNETYNFYAMKSKNALEPLSSENLLYISQAISDENGNLTIDYTMTQDYSKAVCFVVPMKQTDLSNALVTMDNLEYSGEEQFINPTVTLDGVTLTQGKDYELCNHYYAQNPGEYKVIIRGIGNYTGEIEFIYYVNSKIGDVNLDGSITVTDAIFTLKHIININILNSQQEAYADVNEDGVITVVDALMIQRMAIELTPSA